MAMLNKKRVVVGMSGGVDSSVAAYLLKQDGYEVIGATMQIWQDAPPECLDDGGSVSAVTDAHLVAQKLGIPFYVLNFKMGFKNKVIDYFINEYLDGKTPNPCIACNKNVKWESLLQKSSQLGADYIATGHYARVVQINGRYTLKQSASAAKDQTYVLYPLTQYQLSKTLMPCGNYTKDEIRAIAKEIGLSVADKKDSQEICFIPDNDYNNYIKQNSGVDINPGNFVDCDGNILGRHKGIPYYTVGQRKGLGIAFGKPLFVSKINASENEIVLSGNDGLFSDKLSVGSLNFMKLSQINSETHAFGKIRYAHKLSPCKIKMAGNILDCTFDTPQRAAAPGQAAVFYDDEGHILCGGDILG
ncbi:MAG: tRNA 2-thiouridine(34) synthase MnmA [Clostridiales bacterium]|jgi:tRNA-specific 2-thiouridylase|nr:tRNA 2-thiouridine(34) synthase MnmA [Clostridiales bacterium]